MCKMYIEINAKSENKLFYPNIGQNSEPVVVFLACGIPKLDSVFFVVNHKGGNVIFENCRYVRVRKFLVFKSV